MNNEWSLADLTPDERYQLRQLMESPLTFSQNLVINYETQEKFRPQYPQALLFASKKQINWVCWHRRAGKTHALTLLALYFAITMENKRIMYFTPSAPQLEEVFNEKINGWIEANPIFSSMIDHSQTNRNTPNPVRSFVNGSSIQGFVLGTKEGAEQGKRGLTTDILFLDEAQEYTVSDWAVVAAIMGGDPERQKRGGVLTYIAGTVRKPDGHFFKKIKKYPINDELEARFVINVEQNRELTAEQVAKLKASQPPEIWNNEWMLELGDEEHTVFLKDDIMAASHMNWDYGPDKIDWCPLRGKGEFVRFIGVDWDRVGAGTNIAVVQYDCYTRRMWTIDRIEVPRGQFTYYQACEQMFDLYQTYKPLMIVSDAGAGDMQWQYMYIKAGEMGLPDMQQRLVKLALNGKIEVPHVVTGEPDKVYIKPVLVGLLQKKLQERQWNFPDHDEELKMQLLTYKRVQETVNTVKFNSNNEHVIDCHMFAMYGIWTLFEDPLANHDHDLMFRQMGVDKLSFRSEEQVESFWAGLSGDRQDVMGQRSVLWQNHSIGRQDLSERGFNRPLIDRMGQNRQLNHWLMD